MCDVTLTFDLCRDRVTGEDAVATGYVDIKSISTTGDNGLLLIKFMCYSTNPQPLFN